MMAVANCCETSYNGGSMGTVHTAKWNLYLSVNFAWKPIPSTHFTVPLMVEGRGTAVELEQIHVLILNHIRSTVVDWISTGLFF